MVGAWGDDGRDDVSEDEDCFSCPTCKGRGTVNPLTSPVFCAGIMDCPDCPDCDGSGEI